MDTTGMQEYLSTRTVVVQYRAVATQHLAGEFDLGKISSWDNIKLYKYKQFNNTERRVSLMTTLNKHGEKIKGGKNKTEYLGWQKGSKKLGWQRDDCKKQIAKTCLRILIQNIEDHGKLWITSLTAKAP